ncbi:hypothetical protein [Persicirhabdus sediminis]|uniref:SH3 domain-containing protein n=1 Tax=Persicirhabdus sediminis TaxID=454144 RepID=A0A8J7MCX1_9BACT|nr:hypothetical protein [Persicirhabdus sediminis]MBK1790246.1 hypothetical protein [Persicirhabdus sediminis]
MNNFFRISALAIAASALTSCESFNQPLDGSSNPLDPPGSGNTPPIVSTPAFTPGSFVQTNVSNAAFFKNFPAQADQPTKTLPVGTSAKVISLKKEYARVELASGEVGFIPAFMLMDQRSTREVPITPGVVTEPSSPISSPESIPDPEIPSIEPPSTINPGDGLE